MRLAYSRSQRFGTIVADPPWRYQTANQAPTRTAEAHYDTLTTDAIAALPIADLAADVAHLYLWVTNPVLLLLRPTMRGHTTAVEIVRAWGFEPATILTWVKVGADGALHRGGMGWYFRGATEHIIFATRGKAPIPPELREPNVIVAPRGRAGHSSKPPALMDLAERLSPGPRIELFARDARLGWERWGNEAESTVSMEVVVT